MGQHPFRGLFPSSCGFPRVPLPRPRPQLLHLLNGDKLNSQHDRVGARIKGNAIGNGAQSWALSTQPLSATVAVLHFPVTELPVSTKMELQDISLRGKMQVAEGYRVLFLYMIHGALYGK